MSAFTEIATEVLTEHRMGSAVGDPWYKQNPPQRLPKIHTQTYACKCKSWTGPHGDHIKHQAEVLAERLGVTERVEWGIRFGDGDVEEFGGIVSPEAIADVIDKIRRQHTPEKLAEDYEPMAVVSRTVTAFAHVSEWEAVE